MISIAIMCSGKGRLLKYLYDEIELNKLEANINAVFCSRHCLAEKIARNKGTNVFVIPGSLDSETMGIAIKRYDIDLLILTGYTKKVNIPKSFYKKCINIHPSLLPKHGGLGKYGKKVHESVLKSGEKETGCTIHFVDDKYDHGEIILQKKCEILSLDNVDSLSKKVFELEKIAIVEAIKDFNKKG